MKKRYISLKEHERYLRQIIIEDFGVEKQNILKNSSLLLVGCGGIGSGVIPYISAGGIGEIILVDKDKLSVYDLNRQVIYKTKDTGKYKAELARRYIKDLNPNVKVKTVIKEVNYKDLLELSKKVDIVIDATDNFKTRFDINRACYKNKKKYVFASVYRYEAQMCVFDFPNSPCLNCIYDEELENVCYGCSDYGIIGAVCGIIGAMTAFEAIKILCGMKYLKKKMFVFDFLNYNFSFIDLKKRKDCKTCGRRYG